MMSMLLSLCRDLFLEEVLDEASEEQIFLLGNRREDSSECEMWQRMLWGGHLAFEQQALECREVIFSLLIAWYDIPGHLQVSL